MELRDIILRYRHDHGLSQRAFARICGVSNGFIAQLESGKNPNTGEPMTPSFKNLQSMAEAMGITTRALLDMADDINFTNEEDSPIPEIALLNEKGQELVREFSRMLSKIEEYKR